jgi:hypothetical protein
MAQLQSTSVTGSLIATSLEGDSLLINADVFELTGSLKVLGSITGSIFGTASFATTASYVNASNIQGISSFRIGTGSISASVNVTPENLFLINSGFTQYFNISSSGNTDIYSNLFIVHNFTTKQPVLTVSQSVIQIATQSFDPTGDTIAGSIWFTSASMYVGLEDYTYIEPN